MSNLPANQYTDYMMDEARQDAGMGRILEFKKGDYFIDGGLVPTGTAYIVYCKEWIKQWIKFGAGAVEDRKVYHVAKHEMAPDRQSLGDEDQSKWRIGSDGKPWDPWVLQYLLPFAERETGELVVFRTSSWGGKRAVGNLIMEWGNKARYGGEQNPVIKIGVFHEQTKKFGRIARPLFSVIDWDVKGETVVMPDIKDEMDDQIPF